MLSRRSSLVLAAVAAALQVGAALAIDPLPTGPALERVMHRLGDPLVERMARTGSEAEARAETLVETTPVPGGTGSLRRFYSLGAGEGRRSATLVAEERWEGGALSAFRHRYVLSGEERWSEWLPASLRTGLSFGWPDLSPSGRGIIRRASETSPELLELTRQALLRAHSALQAGEPEGTLEAAAADWSPGTRNWSYDPAKWKPWHGYLWDFHKGYLWKGYRKGSELTPSQKQDSSDVTRIREYYGAFDAGLPDGYDASNSRALSPLDKFGIWAQRTGGQTWWHAPAWEAANHHKNQAWGGYCNGSAAAALLWKKPAKGFVSSGLAFEPRDVVGLLQAASFRVDLLFWGRRFNSSGAGDDISDPPPHLVLGVLERYLHRQGAPVVVDVHADEQVDNAVVIGATVALAEGAAPDERAGELRLTMVHYFPDGRIGAEDPGVVPEGTRRISGKWKFRMKLNPDGTPASSSWEKAKSHPDFLWIPTGNNDYSPPHRRNPYLKMDLVRALVSQSY